MTKERERKGVNLTFLYPGGEVEELPQDLREDLEELGKLTTTLVEHAYNASKPGIALKALSMAVCVICDHLGVPRAEVAEDITEGAHTFPHASLQSEPSNERN